MRLWANITQHDSESNIFKSKNDGLFDDEMS